MCWFTARDVLTVAAVASKGDQGFVVRLVPNSTQRQPPEIMVGTSPRSSRLLAAASDLQAGLSLENSLRSAVAASCNDLRDPF